MTDQIIEHDHDASSTEEPVRNQKFAYLCTPAGAKARSPLNRQLLQSTDSVPSSLQLSDDRGLKDEIGDDDIVDEDDTRGNCDDCTHAFCQAEKQASSPN